MINVQVKKKKVAKMLEVSGLWSITGKGRSVSRGGRVLAVSGRSQRLKTA